MAEKKKVGIVRRLFRFIGRLLLFIVLLAAALVGYLTLTEFKPADTEAVEIGGKASRTLSQGAAFTVASWNIGYCALGDDADFFMDGGTMVKTADQSSVLHNLEEILRQIDKLRPDVLFLQETDQHSARSSFVDEYASAASHMEGFTSSFANNFKVAFLPYPVPPIGRVDSGVATFSAFDVTDAQRIQLPIPFSWPMRMANLKRCLLVSRVPVDGGKELTLINLHLEAYDDGEGKLAQTKMLSDLMAEEAKKGNYVIAGGDFNQMFSSADSDAFPAQEGNWIAPVIDESQFGDGWQFLMDSEVPSCRSLYKPYADADHDTFQYYLLDGFIVSKNIAVQSFAAQDLGFAVSDHNPVVMQVTLR